VVDLTGTGGGSISGIGDLEDDCDEEEDALPKLSFHLLDFFEIDGVDEAAGVADDTAEEAREDVEAATETVDALWCWRYEVDPRDEDEG